MRTAIFLILCLLTIFPAVGQPDSIAPAAGVSARGDRDEARWADWEAQARITDGDYDGAVQAEQQAEAERHEADRQEMLARASRR